MKLTQRSSGILLHISSLPSDFGIGDMGPASFRFVELLSKIKQRYWNILPIGPTSLAYGNSPYRSMSSFAGNTLLISPEGLVKDGFLSKEQLRSFKILSTSRVDYRTVTWKKDAILRKAFSCFRRKSLVLDMKDDLNFEGFCSENSVWLDDYCLFKALRDKIGKPWYSWPHLLRDRNRQTIVEKKQSLKESIECEKFAQYSFSKQYLRLRNHCLRNNVRIIGDLPFYVGYDSADVWVHPEMFKLDDKKRPRYVGGVPPDYFSRYGQLWGDPVYDWPQMEKAGFKFWTERITHSLTSFDMLRLDHFRGFIAYWQIPFPAKTARKGKWIRSPTTSFFRNLKREVPSLPFIAEDLGVVTDSVRQVIESLGIPGMKVLLFAFGGSPRNPHLPTNHPGNSVVFTGTHDTNTAKGWFTQEATLNQRQTLFRCIGKIVSEKEVSRELVRLALAAKSNLSIIPMQDLLSLDSAARMNDPARLKGNWEWRATSDQMLVGRFEEFGEMAVESDRNRITTTVI